MKKRSLAVAMLAAMAMLPMAAPPTQVRAEYKPDWESFDIKKTWIKSAHDADWAKNLDITRQENESEYEYYYRMRELMLSSFTLVQSAPTTVEEAREMGANKQFNADRLMEALYEVMGEKSNIHFDVRCMDLDGTLSSASIQRYTELVNEFGQTQTVLNTITDCVCNETWREKGIFGAVKLDGNLYAIRIGADASDWATLIPYTDLGCPDCQYDLTWGYSALSTRKYEDAGKSTLGNYRLEVYNSDGSFDYDDVYRVRWKTGNIPWEVQGVTQYYCENGIITPMTEALHNTLPNNDFINYGIGFMKGELKRFVE